MGDELLNEKMQKKYLEWVLRIGIAGEPIWDFVEIWANWAVPLALFLVLNQKKKESTVMD